jgi:GT2 family glycosyltransferase
MVLSVIIVNYQVKYFLEQCLFSVEKALKAKGEAEIIVVDNHSQDGSMEYLEPKFPGVKFLSQTENLGFSRANNLALTQAKGRYILFLNPDTILPEDFFSVCIPIVETTPGIGAAGVRMVDGSGRFLKESRRGFPTPWVAFCKLSGLSSLFPKSRLLAGYYLGHLPEKKTQPAPVLSGACLWVPRKVLEETGNFDERYFMYAEDIDLSYRIEQKGFTNYYIADTTILHFKGESTRKDAKYIKLFYGAMVQFRRKHFKSFFSRIFNSLLAVSIRLKAVISSPVPPDTSSEYDEILMEGEDRSFKEIIGSLSPGKKALIRASGSGSAVGSPLSEGRGIVITF